MKFKEFAIKAKDEEKGNGGFEGYAATFDRVPDSYGDVIAQGAFTNTLKAWQESGRPIPVLYGHNMDDPDYNIGVAECTEDEKGLHVIAKFDSSEKAQRTRELLKDGRLGKMSFAFNVLDEGTVKLEDGTKANELRELELFEVSVVLVPANSFAEITETKARKDQEEIGPAEDEPTDEVEPEQEVELNLDELMSALDTAKAAIEQVADLINSTFVDNADEEPEDEEPEEAKSLAKSREIISKLKKAIED